MTASAAFLLAFPALFSIVNPIGNTVIFFETTADLTKADRARLAGLVALYALAVMLGSLWAGTYILNFFGITIPALRIAGGAVVALRAWELLNAPERHEERKAQQAGASGRLLAEMAFFPLTMPFTTGPGTIAVSIALGAVRPPRGSGLLFFFLGVSAAAVAIAGTVWVAYRSAGRIASFLGASGRRTLSRIMAFLLLCIGVQILVTGIEGVGIDLLGRLKS
jgi:multiple antibiotic resistance protein